MINIRRRRREVPALNTASLPDLIFTVLFFFIIVTHMREDNVRVKYSVPDGKELAKTIRKSAVIRLYVGKPLAGGTGYRIQLDDKLVAPDQLADRVAAVCGGMSPDDAQEATVLLSADKDVDMQTIVNVKQALRRGGVKRITYVGTEKETQEKQKKR